MADLVKIDAGGFNSMIRQMKRFHGEASKPIVRAITSDILALAAKKTKTTQAKAVAESVAKNFRKPFEVPGVGFVGLTKSGKVWINLVSWGNKKRWALINSEGKLKNPPKTIKRTGKKRAGSNLKLSSKDKAKMKTIIKAAKAFKKRQLAYKKSMIGLSKASWYQLIRMLKLPMPSDAPAKVAGMKVPPSALRQLRAYHKVRGKDDFSIIVRSTVQASLNNKSGGIKAFQLAMNGKVKEFKTAMKKGGTGYAKKFAQRHGFTVK